MKIPFLDLHLQLKEEIHDLKHVFENILLNDTLSGGEATRKFESQFSSFIGTDFCVGCANGTDALEVILRAIGVGQGDEIILPANGWLSAAEMVYQLQATPVYVDADWKTRNIDTSLIEEKITPSTKAIIPIHLYGLPADMKTIRSLADRYNLYAVEDCAQAHGASFANTKVGNWGHASAFSFYPTKNLGALGEAGAINTSHIKLANACRMLINHGQIDKNVHKSFGRNSRIDSLQAGFLNYRLNKLDSYNEKRQDLAKIYLQALQGLPIGLPHTQSDIVQVYHLFVITTDCRDRLQNFLHKRGIGTAVHYPKAVSDLPHLNPSACPVATRLSQQVLSLPLHPYLSEDEVHVVCTAIHSFFA